MIDLPNLFGILIADGEVTLKVDELWTTLRPDLQKQIKEQLKEVLK